MKILSRIIGVFSYLYVLLFILAFSAFGSDVYIAQFSTGADTGLGCASAHSASWFNSNATGGNTYHLCGTFTGSAGGTMFTVPASGSAGNPLTMLFESGAVLTAPYWSGATGAIYINGKNYVTIDGGTNGVIKNTANGTLKTYQQGSRGVYITNSDHITIKNLHVQDIFNKVGKTIAGAGGTGIEFRYNNSNILIDNNVVSSASDPVYIVFEGSTLANLEIKNNTVSDACHMILVGGGASNSIATNISIHNNEVFGWDNWSSPSDCHTDGIFVFLWEGNTSNMTAEIYNNYIHGRLWDGVTLNSSPTAHIFCTYGESGGGTNGAACNIYNNLSVDSSMTAIWAKKTASIRHRIYNNTIVNSPYGVIFENATGAVFQNNILKNTQFALKSYGTLQANIAASNYNLFDNTGVSSFAVTDAGQYNTYANWRALGYDANSRTSSSLLNANYSLQPGSPAINNGTTGIYAYDYIGTSRPQGLAWDIGAYEYIAKQPLPANILGITP